MGAAPFPRSGKRKRALLISKLRAHERRHPRGDRAGHATAPAPGAAAHNAASLPRPAAHLPPPATSAAFPASAPASPSASAAFLKTHESEPLIGGFAVGYLLIVLSLLPAMFAVRMIVTMFRKALEASAVEAVVKEGCCTQADQIL